MTSGLSRPKEHAMIEPVGPRLFPNPHWIFDGAAEEPTTTKKNVSAEAEVASLYYQSSIMSLAAPETQPAKSAVTAAKVETSQPQKSWFGRTKDWLWGLFGLEKKQPTDASQTFDDEILDGIPRLAPPETKENKRMARTIAELNREFVNRMKDIAEFEEEMRKSSSNDLDKMIFMQLVFSSLYQKDLKEDGNITAHQQVLAMHDRNKTLQKTYYDMLEEITRRAKTNEVLHWTGIGLTAGVVGALAVSFAIGGPVAVIGSVAIGLMSLAKGGTTMSEGILKYKNDRKTGDMFIIGQESKANSKRIDDEMGNMQMNDDDVGKLLKTIRHHLDNQSRAERANFGK